MSFSGKLDQFRFPDLLQALALTGKSGKLVLTQREAEGMVVLRGGKIIYAASSTAREALGNLLVHQKLISEEALLAALEEHHERNEEVPLGNILIANGHLTHEQLEEVVTGQVARVIHEFFDWQKGYFQFDLVDLPDRGEIQIDAADFLLQKGISPDKILLEIAQKLEALEAEPQEPAAVEEAAQPTPAAQRGSSLQDVMREIRAPEFTGEVTQRILSCAARHVKRAVLFYVTRSDFRGMGGFGAEPESIREMKIPLREPSVLLEAADRKITCKGPLADNEWNNYLVESLGGVEPIEAIAIPLVVNSVVLLVLYGDNIPGNSPVPPMVDLEVVMLQAGLAMETKLLDQRMEQFKRLRSSE